MLVKYILCTLWKWDPIFRKPVTTQYTDQQNPPFGNIIFSGSEKENTDESAIPWQWLENHTKMYQYSLNIKKYEDSSCCSPKRHKETAIFLAENNGFFPPVIKDIF
jgi:hypothetical protein